jgi:uncharacterized membrane protein
VSLVAVSSFQFSLFLHITAVVVGFGSTFAESVTFPIAMKLDRRHLPYVHRLQRTINLYFATPALVVVIATGFYQVDKLNLSLGKPWLSASLALVAVIAVLNIAYFIPQDKKLEAMVSRELAAAGDGEVELSSEYMTASRNTGIAGALTGVMLVVIIYLMVATPGA